MRVLILGSYAPSLLNFRGPLIRAILATGHQVSLGAPEIPASLRTQLEDMGATVYDTPLKRTGIGLFSDFQYCRTLRKILKHDQPDILLTYTIKPNIWGAFSAASVGVPSVAMVTGLGYTFTDSGRGQSIRERLTKLVARNLYRAATHQNSRVIFQNPDDCLDFIKAGCLADPTKSAVVDGSGVDLDYYTRTPLPDHPVILMIARLLGNKGVREYAAAAQKLHKLRPQAQFILVGPFDNGPDSIRHEELNEWIAAGLDYRGAVNDVRPIISEAQIYVLPSYREGTPRSVLEAMAMGRPVITTDAPGCRETVIDGINGLLIPVRDSEALVTAIIRLIDNPMETSAMGDAAYEFAERRYNVQRVNQSIMDLLELKKI